MAMQSRFVCLTGHMSRSRRYNDSLRSRGHADLARDDDRRRRQNAVASSRRFQGGGETKALPAIWSDKADLDARCAELSQDTTVTLATIKDQASFAAAMPGIFKNFRGGCHGKYRASEN
jgi:cytochrome c556